MSREISQATTKRDVSDDNDEFRQMPEVASEAKGYPYTYPFTYPTVEAGARELRSLSP